MEDEMISYSVVIRTLGKSGEKYQATLNAIKNQTIQPEEVIVVIPEGYELPREKIGTERFVFSGKGMVIQRAVGIKENKSEYALLLDDDVSFENDFVKQMYNTLNSSDSQIVIPIVRNVDGSFVMLQNYDSTRCNYLLKNIKSTVISWFIGVRQIRRNLDGYCLKISKTGGYLVQCRLDEKKQYFAQTGSGAVCFGKSKSLRVLKFEDEIWLDEGSFAVPEDQVMFYKLFLQGNKIALNQNTLFMHLDSGSGRPRNEKSEKILYALERNGVIFWHRFIYTVTNNNWMKIRSLLSLTMRIMSVIIFFFVFGLMGKNEKKLSIVIKAYVSAFRFIKSKDYKSLQKI